MCVVDVNVLSDNRLHCCQHFSAWDKPSGMLRNHQCPQSSWCPLLYVSMLLSGYY